LKAGIDMGTSRIKAVWQEDGQYQYKTAVKTRLCDIIKTMKLKKIKELNLSGTGCEKRRAKTFSEFKINIAKGDPILNEINLQCMGAKKILRINGNHLENFLLASIGTGTSYTLINKNKIQMFPLGNPNGSGLINGIRKFLGIKTFSTFTNLASQGTSPDILVKDLLPKSSNSLTRDLVVSNFGKANTNTTLEDACAGFIHCVAVNIVRDVMLIQGFPNFSSFQNIVFIGTSISKIPLLQEIIAGYSPHINKNLYFPKLGEFSLAMGAYHMD